MPGKEVPITELGPSHLNQLSQQLDQEIEFIQNSMSQLKVVQTKFVESRDSLDKIIPDNKGKEILVPLTSSMYVNGQLSDVEKVLINIGTGYYIEKPIPEAKEYFKRKMEYLTTQIEKLQPALQEKYKMKQAVVEMLQVKVQAQIAAQQQVAKS
ncbi:hypothetical protein LSH36_241g04056 [Paralvinella palmiformis]|uniref:Prefoldin subunit 5 n=1 Tax=Paralvinella palmiformis TaxID=53620 RepID=A0AAD9N5U5_9ANNE|nr:hypothetical protein LSH36_241g04056 [Paralvinella palmiformis]